MNIYIITQQFLSGTVTISTHVIGIEANSFDEAIKKYKSFAKEKDLILLREDNREDILNSGERKWSFEIEQKELGNLIGDNYCIMSSIPLEILK